ncbi:A/G-specific adenine glycosylase [Anaeromyxobacter diazotrophicus]|nr:A/G-specific adenine glycosylase [Anaeromyxobacter diazotrophicus]
MPVLPSARRSALRRRLLAWWDAGHRELPWRFPTGEADPYRVWISEVMLQQTQVAAVVPYYLRFLERFPTLEALAEASEDEVLARWSGLGYYARGRRLRAAAREMLARHGGVPRSREALAALPGFGPYTAGAVASIAFGLEEPCVDGNVARVLARLGCVEGAPEAPATRARLWALAAELVRGPRPGELNQALMDLGATVCGKAAPRCARCPVAPCCAARARGRERELPPARARRAPRRLEVACAVVVQGGRLLLERRPPGGLFGGLWELPGAEVAPGATAPAALAEALALRGLRVRVGKELARVERVLTHRRLALTAFRGSVARLPPPGGQLRLAAPEELPALALSAATRALVEALPASGRPAARRRIREEE